LTACRLPGARFEAVHAAGLTDLIGREDELDFLLKRQRLAWKGEGQIVLISGEAGIGKSRLVAALEQWHRRRAVHALALPMFASPHQQRTLSVYRPIGASGGFKADDASEQRLDKLEALIAIAATESSR